MITGSHMTIGEFIELLLSGELTIERLKKFGNKLDEFAEKYIAKRADVGYNVDTETEMNLLVGYLRHGLPDRFERILEKGRNPRDRLFDFVQKYISSDTHAFVITYATREKIKQALGE